MQIKRIGMAQYCKCLVWAETQMWKLCAMANQACPKVYRQLNWDDVKSD